MTSGQEKTVEKKTLVIAAGDSGVHVGLAAGGARALGGDGRLELTQARHLRYYYVAGRTGDGSVSDLAVRGLDLGASSVSDPVPGVTCLTGVRRALDVAPGVAGTFEVPAP